MSMKMNKKGKEYPVGVIPKNYPASNISYNNSQSGLSADNVQGAIDELDDAVDTINTALLKAEIKTVTFTNVGFNSYSNNSGGVFICSADSTHLVANGNAASYTRLFNVNNQNPGLITDSTVVMDCLVFSHV